MENVINRIIEIDQHAKQQLLKAAKRKEQILSDAKAEVAAIRQKVLDRASGRVAKVEEFEKTNADEKIEHIKDQMNSRIEMIDKTFIDNHKQWESEIYSRIINGLKKS